MHLDSDEYYRLQNLLNRCGNTVEVNEICREFCVSNKFDFFSFCLCRLSSLVSPEIVSIDNYPQAWIDLYNKEQLRFCDPLIQYSLKYSTPVRWDDLPAIKDFYKQEYESYFEKAERHALVSGFTIPVNSPSSALGVFSLVSSKSSRETGKLLNETLPRGQLFASLVMDALQSICFSDVKLDLTNREKECLFWACEGKTTWEISRILDVSESTVIFHLTNAGIKVGARNRQHAVAKSILLGLVEPEIKPF